MDVAQKLDTINFLRSVSQNRFHQILLVDAVARRHIRVRSKKTNIKAIEHSQEINLKHINGAVISYVEKVEMAVLRKFMKIAYARQIKEVIRKH